MNADGDVTLLPPPPSTFIKCFRLFNSRNSKYKSEGALRCHAFPAVLQYCGFVIAAVHSIAFHPENMASASDFQIPSLYL